MNNGRPLFILAGNAPYENRGCEAILRGTVNILRKFFRDPRFVCLSHFQSGDQYELQCLLETDDAIIHLDSCRLNKKKVLRNFWRPEMWSATYQNFFDKDAFYARAYKNMLNYLDESKAVLSIGGDNYSLDYGVPILFTALDNLVLKHKKPIILWGSSVGPFSAMPEYEHFMHKHLQKVTGILARESATIDYLESIGVSKNIYSVADPAFLMDAKPAEDKISIEKEAIGLNFSPLMAKYITDGNIELWTKLIAKLIVAIEKRTERRIYLIPHVTTPISNDYFIMKNALSKLPGKNNNVTLVPPEFNAAEIKWIISQMELFAGARTHSTIAALSSYVPTLSFAYSIKARGINRDLFGSKDYCLEPMELNAKTLCGRILHMLNEITEIKSDLKKRIPETQKAAMNAGAVLKQLTNDD